MIDGTSILSVVDEVAAHEVGVPRTVQAAQAEYFLAAGRQPELRPGIAAALARLSERTQLHLERRGAPQAESAAEALVTLADGALLERLASLDVDHAARLASGVRLLLAAAQLTTEEVDELLARYDDV